MAMIPVYKPQFDDQDREYLNEAIKSGQWARGGNFVEQLEEEFAEYVGTDHAIAVSSWPTAAYLVLKNTYTRDMVLKVPSCTFVGIMNAVKQANCRYRLIDEIFVGKKYGLSPLRLFDASYDIKQGQSLSTGIYSFYPTRQIASFDGGMITVNKDEAAEWYRKARSGGREDMVYTWDYDVAFPGYRAEMTEVQAALALSQLRKIQQNDAKRQKIVDTYNERLEEKNTSLTIYPILVRDRDDFIEFAEDRGIEISVHFRPLHWLKAYKILRFRYPFPKSETWGDQEASLPLYPDMIEAEIDTVCNMVLEWRKLEEKKYGSDD